MISISIPARLVARLEGLNDLSEFVEQAVKVQIDYEAEHGPPGPTVELKVLIPSALEARAREACGDRAWQGWIKEAIERALRTPLHIQPIDVVLTEEQRGVVFEALELFEGDLAASINGVKFGGDVPERDQLEERDFARELCDIFAGEKRWCWFHKAYHSVGDFYPRKDGESLTGGQMCSDGWSEYRKKRKQRNEPKS